MPKPRLSMRKLREVLRLRFGKGLSERQVYEGLGVVETDAGTYLVVHKNGTIMQIESDSSSSVVTRVVSGDGAGNEMVIDFDETGFPSTMFVNGSFILFNRVGDAKMDFALADPNGKFRLFRDVAIVDTLTVTDLGKLTGAAKISGSAADDPSFNPYVAGPWHSRFPASTPALADLELAALVIPNG